VVPLVPHSVRRDIVDAAVKTLSQNWWLILMQGVLSLVLGVLALVWPGRTLGILILFFGLFALLNGIVEVFAAIGAAGVRQPWGWRLASGMFGILAGLAILKWPGVTALLVVLLIGLWAIITGIIAIVRSIADRAELRHAWLVGLGGIVSVLFGIAMFAWPGVGLFTLAYLVGIYAIVFGVIECALAFEMRTLPRRITGPASPRGAQPSY
jgi:uncharacterized membrane protein HdeD (DUF308 family)